MAGGTWNKLSGKTRPGTYINYTTTETSIVGVAERGTVLLPLIGHPYGPEGEFITIENSNPDAHYAELGYSVYEEPLLLVKEALKLAKKCIVYIPAQGNKASATTDIPVYTEEEEVSETASTVTEAVSTYLGAKEDLTGCSLNFDEDAGTLTVTLTGALSEVKNTGIIDTLTALVDEGCTVTIDGTEITGLADLKTTDAYATLAALAEGDSASFTVVVSKDGVEETYTIAVDYPSESEAAAISEDGEETETTDETDSSSSTVTLKATAMYGGIRGNDLSFDCVANEDGTFDVTVYMENDNVELIENVSTIGDLINSGSEYIVFSGDEAGELDEFSAISLEGGTEGTVSTLDMTTFLDKSEAISWNTMAFPLDSSENASLLTAAVSKIKYLRDDVGKYRELVVADYTCDYEGVINVANSYKLSDGTELTHAQATAWVAGADAGADCVTSNTYQVVEDATDIVDLYSHSEVEAAINAGKFVFTFNESQEVIAEYDINSLTTYGDGNKAKSWRKNRVRRVLDTFGESIQLNFTPNKYDNDSDGWDIMEGIGTAILKLYGPKSDGGVGAIDDIDYENDFLVDRANSAGDEVYFNVGIKPVDSAEKLFFTITTR